LARQATAAPPESTTVGGGGIHTQGEAAMGKEIATRTGKLWIDEASTAFRFDQFPGRLTLRWRSATKCR
jgi:hypothetical protein